MSEPEPEFVRLQRAFTDHLRDPENHPPPGTHEDRRLAVYQHAIYANVAGLMSDNYPRIRALMDDACWSAMMRDYIVRHRARASAFVDVPGEFYTYLVEERQSSDDPPFLTELAHFDWLETLVGADERRVDMSGIQRDGDLIKGIPIANPTLRMIDYQYPVHAINVDYQPPTAPRKVTHIAAFRDLENLYGFLDLNDASAALLTLVTNSGTASGHQLVDQFAKAYAVADAGKLLEQAREILERMRQRGAILGVLTVNGPA